jgi:O-antigen/teichoic acid export membrane protein
MKIRILPSQARSLASAMARRCRTSDLEHQLLGGAAWTVIGTASTRGAMLVASLVLARLLGRHTFGEFAAVESTIAMLAVLGNMGLSLSATKFVSKYQHAEPAKAGRMLALCYVLSAAAGLVAMVSLILIAPWLAGQALDAPQLAIDLRIAALALVASAVQATLSGALLGLQAFRAGGMANLVVGAMSLPILVLGGVIAGIRGAVIGLVVAQALQAVALAVALRPILHERGLRPVWQGCWNECGELLRFALAALLNSSLVAPVNWLLVVMLVRYGGGYGELGLFQVANSWFLVLLFIPGKLSQVYYPLVEDLLARGESRTACSLIWKLVRLNATVFGALAVLGTLASPLILHWYGPEFLPARPALVLTLWTAVCVAATQPLTALVFAHSRMWQVTLCSLCWAAVSIATFSQLLNYGATGAAAARLMGYGAHGALMAAVTLWFLRQPADPNQTAPISSPWLEPAPSPK